MQQWSLRQTRTLHRSLLSMESSSACYTLGSLWHAWFVHRRSISPTTAHPIENVDGGTQRQSRTGSKTSDSKNSNSKNSEKYSIQRNSLRNHISSNSSSRINNNMKRRLGNPKEQPPKRNSNPEINAYSVLTKFKISMKIATINTRGFASKF